MSERKRVRHLSTNEEDAILDCQTDDCAHHVICSADLDAYRNEVLEEAMEAVRNSQAYGWSSAYDLIRKLKVNNG